MTFRKITLAIGITAAILAVILWTLGILKIVAVITWSWWIVLIPLWLLLVLGAVALLWFLLMALTFKT